MEFSEKLQQLRKQNNLTQQQLADKLYVSRTAVSKWESGRGYPGIDSLKCISTLFAVSVDDLLSKDELVSLAEQEQQHTKENLLLKLFSWVDIMTLTLLFLPLFSQEIDGHFYNIPVFQLQTAYWIFVLSSLFPGLQGLTGGIGLILQSREAQQGFLKVCTGSLLLHILAILFFIATRQLYVSALLFLLLILKTVLLFKADPWKAKS